MSYVFCDRSILILTFREFVGYFGGTFVFLQVQSKREKMNTTINLTLVILITIAIFLSAQQYLTSFQSEIAKNTYSHNKQVNQINKEHEKILQKLSKSIDKLKEEFNRHLAAEKSARDKFKSEIENLLEVREDFEDSYKEIEDKIKFFQGQLSQNEYNFQELNKKLEEFEGKLEELLSTTVAPTEITESNNSNTNCSLKSFGDNFPITALHSFMGAGNTWLRYLIESTTGYYTGSAFRDRSLEKAGFLGEQLPVSDYKKIIAIKSHNIRDAKGEQELFRTIKISYTSKCIILIRNPFNTFMAEANRLLTGGHKGVVADKNKLLDFFQNSKFAQRWIDENKWMNSYIEAYQICQAPQQDLANGLDRFKLVDEENKKNQSKEVLIVLYENLQDNLIEEMIKITKFLGNRVGPKFLLSSFSSHHEKLFLRFLSFNLSKKYKILLKNSCFANL